ncbi:unnamed protein product [Caretta caretta]
MGIQTALAKLQIPVAADTGLNKKLGMDSLGLVCSLVVPKSQQGIWREMSQGMTVTVVSLTMEDGRHFKMIVVPRCSRNEVGPPGVLKGNQEIVCLNLHEKPLRFNERR